ncbi:hypothetical protein IE53DRAFT_385910, partial [Violaceomyces palustris]
MRFICRHLASQLLPLPSSLLLVPSPASSYQPSHSSTAPFVFSPRFPTLEKNFTSFDKGLQFLSILKPGPPPPSYWDRAGNGFCRGQNHTFYHRHHLRLMSYGVGTGLSLGLSI